MEVSSHKPLTHTCRFDSKEACPNDIRDFRPISLCNVIYNLVTKVITNRLKVHLPYIISENQSAFIPGRIITDNILVAFEIFHDMDIRPRSNRGMALKLDMTKDFDRVERPFPWVIMLKMGFCANWVNLVMKFVSSLLLLHH